MDALIANPFFSSKVIETMDVALVFLSAKLNIVSVNRAFERITGYHRSELLGMNAFDFAVKIDRNDEFGRQFDQLASSSNLVPESDSCESIQFTLHSKFGDDIPASSSISAMTNRGGKVVNYIITIKELSELKKVENELRGSLEKLNRTLEGTVTLLANFSQARDPYTAAHQRRVAKLACSIAKKMGLGDEELNGLNMASSIHDIGKIAVPAEILSKPGRLSEAEMTMIKTHPQVAYEMLKSIDFPWPVADIVLQHHECINGSGYPKGLAGEEISIEANILHIADVVEAISTHRPYRPSLGINTALGEITEKKGTVYMSDGVEACLSVFQDDHFKLATAEPMDFRNW
jgi:PAS domain S-box-containing protein/putative nucleotidyltransferase with HDIG domain